jgi:hypothetical protein
MVASHGPTKNDKLLVQKLRDLKVKYQEVISGSSLSGGYHTLPEEEVTLQKENAQLKRDIEFCNSEIERLRAKLIVGNDDEAQMPPLADELFSQPKANNFLRDSSLDGGTDLRGGDLDLSTG